MIRRLPRLVSLTSLTIFLQITKNSAALSLPNKCRLEHQSLVGACLDRYVVETQKSHIRSFFELFDMIPLTEKLIFELNLLTRTSRIFDPFVESLNMFQEEGCFLECSH